MSDESDPTQPQPPQPEFPASADTAGEAGGPSPSSPAPAATSSAPSDLRRLTWALLALAVLLIIWLVWPRGGDFDPQRFFPPRTKFFLQCNDPQPLGKALARLPLWKEGEGEAGVHGLWKWWLDKGERHLGVDALDLERLASGARGVGAGLVPRRDKAGYDLLLVLAPENPSAMLAQIKQAAAEELEPVAVPETSYEFLRFKLENGKMFHVLVLEHHLLLSAQKERLTFALQALNENEPGLGDTAVMPRHTERGAVRVMIDPRADPLSGQPLGYFLRENLRLGLDLTRHMREEARLVWTLRPQAPHGLRAETRVVLAREAVKRHGVLYYLGWTFLIVVLIVLAIPVLFIVLSLLMACWFYLVAWWNGELTPPKPEAAPELSPELRADMGDKTATAAPEPQTSEASEPDPHAREGRDSAGEPPDPVEHDPHEREAQGEDGQDEDRPQD